MKNRIFRKEWIEQFEELKNSVNGQFGEEGSRNLKEKISKLASYHYNKKKFILLGEDRMV